MIDKRCEIDMKFEDGVLNVSLCGEIDHHSAVKIRGDIDAKINADRPQKTVMDLSGIEFMDSSGLGLIMGRYALVQRIGGELSVKNPNERVIKIFELAGLDRIISIEAGEKLKATATQKSRKHKKTRKK